MSIVSQYITPKLNTSRIDDRFQYRYDIQCFNDSRYDVISMHRNNIAIVVSGIPIQQATSGKITIRTTHTFIGAKTISDMRNKLEKQFILKKQHMSPDAEIIFKLLTTEHPNNQNATIKIDRVIDIREVITKQQLYIQDLDMMLYTDSFQGEMVHPYSEYALVNKIGDTLLQTNLCTSGVAVQIVDNEDTVSRRFMYVCNKLTEVPVIKDSSRRSGAYVSYITNNEAITEHHELDTLEKLTIYPTAEEAQAHGKLDLVHEKTVRELKHKLETESVNHKIELQKIQEDYEYRKREADLANEERKRQSDILNEQRKREAEIEINRIKLNYEEGMRTMEEERLRKKDQYEERTYQRKDTTETIKTVGIAVASVLSIIAIINNKK